MNKELANKIVLLNGFRAELGLVALETWTKSENALDAEIIKTQTQVIERAENAKSAKYAAEVKSMLTRLNVHLAAMGKADVKEWNGTLDELSKRVAQAHRAHREMVEEDKKMKKVSVSPVITKSKTEEAMKGHKALKGKKLVAKVEKATTKAKAKKTIAAAPVAEQGLLPRIAAELNMNPKVARAKLRKAHGSDWRKMNEKEIRKALS
jgi:cellobiose-specific phosphotransferase system component IIA